MRAPPQVAHTHYFTEVYDNPGRFSSYWHQIDETTQLGGRVLEIGTGNGTVAAVLRARGLDVTTVDVDVALAPDVVADIRELPFADGSFDTGLAAEVLEHLEWDEVPKAVAELARVVCRGVVISVPNTHPALSLDARIPNALQIARLLVRRRIPIRDGLWALTQRVSWRRSGGRVQRFGEVDRLHSDAPFGSDQHFWELGLRGRTRDDVLALFEQHGFELLRDYRGPRFPYHHFFVFSKSG
jgi:SAM-dependent methyltransferase